MTIDASGGQGQQIGSGNVQHNVWTTNTLLDPASLSALTPHRAAVRIRRISHDAAVDFFARVSVGDTQEIIRELLRTDENKIISILADLNRRRAEILVQPFIHDFSWLEDLPKAAEDIASRAAAWDLGDDAEPVRLERIEEGAGATQGFVRMYKKGALYWNEGTVCAVSGQIAEYYAETGGAGGILGFPLEQVTAFADSQHGAKGMAQRFKAGIVCSSTLGIYEISAQFSEIYQSVDGFRGWLGFPVSSKLPNDENVKVQRFEGGAIFSSRYGTFPVRKAIDECAGGLVPLTNEVNAGRSPISRLHGKMQSFRVGPGAKVTVYSSDYGIHRVGWKILNYYQAAGGPTSRLGYPVSGISIVEKQGYMQMFQGGCVYVASASGIAVTVPSATVDRLERNVAAAAKLGWPISEEKRIENDEMYIQFFDNGVVTRRENSEIWLRP